MLTDTDAQRIVTRGYAKHLRRNYFFRIGEGPDPRKGSPADTVLPADAFYQLIKLWLSVGALSTGREKSSPALRVPAPGEPCFYAVDVGLTFAGFKALAAHAPLLDIFRQWSPAFSEGAFLRASARLGDAGTSDPTHWDTPYRHEAAHGVLIVHVAERTDAACAFLAFEACIGQFLGRPAPPRRDAASETWIEHGSRLGDPREVHFGYVDGVSSPDFSANGRQGNDSPTNFNAHCFGELLLGHAKNDQSNPWMAPGRALSPRPGSSFNAAPTCMAYGKFFKDGTFAVLRKLEQDVGAFEKFLDQQARVIGGSRKLEFTKGWIKAKMMGRWPNGSPLEEGFETTDFQEKWKDQEARIQPVWTASKLPENSFSYKQDCKGLKVPFGAHIRRMNPRDDPVVPLLRRPLLRRGTPYGPPYQQGEGAEVPARGLLGLFFCASLEEQFEHILGNWANNNPMGTPHGHAGKCPVIGNHAPIGFRQTTDNSFEIPMRGPVPLHLKGLSAFVRTRGTCYAFFPSVTALKTIADGRLDTAAKFIVAK